MGQRKNRMRSAARIADESARKSSKTRRRRQPSAPRRVRESTAPQKAQRARKGSKKSSTRKSSRSRTHKSKGPSRGEFYKTLRLAIVVFAMAALGFLIVVGLDNAGKSNEERRTQYVVNESVKEAREAETPVQQESAIGMFFTKLLDRFLDNDLPVVKKRPTKTPPTKEKAVAKKDAKVAAKATPKETPKKARSDKKAPRTASVYKKEVKPLKVAEQKRAKEKRSQRDRLNAILKSVGVEEARAAKND